MFLETMEKVFGSMNKIIVDSDSVGGQGVVPYLPLNEINKINPPDVIGYKKLLEQSKKIFDIGFTKLSDVPFHRLSFMLSQVPDMIKLKAYKTVWQFTCSHLENDRLRRAFSIQPLLVGGNPFNTTCIYSLIHFLERKWGVFFALGGTGAIVKGLQKLMTENDIKVITNKKIVKINTLNKKVIGEIGRASCRERV